MGIITASDSDPQFHVLAVDDSLIDRKLIERLLKTSSFQGPSKIGRASEYCVICYVFDFSLTTVDSGSKALEFLGWNENERNNNETSVSPLNHQEVEVNLVITDYCMPGMTGYDLLRKIKESSYLKNIPVVIMSSENVPSRITRCLEEGAEEFFLKPVRKSDVNKLRPFIMKTKCNNIKKPDVQQTMQTVQQLQQTAQTNNNKRKSMDEGISQDRTRPRYNGLTVMSN